MPSSANPQDAAVSWHESSGEDSAARQRPAPRLGRPPKKHDQRQRIVLTAAKKFATVGYEQCSMAQIAAELELTTPALYHYFPTKQSIFSEIAMTAMKGMHDAVVAAVDTNASAAEQLEALMLAHADNFDQNYWLIIATINGYAGIARREIECLEAFERYRNGYARLLEQILKRGVKSGEFRKLDIQQTSRSVFQLLNITRWYRPEGKKKARDFARDNYALLIGGLSAAS